MGRGYVLPYLRFRPPGLAAVDVSSRCPTSPAALVRGRRPLVPGVVAVALLLAGVLLADGILADAALGAERVTIVPQEAWSGVLAGRPVTLHYAVSTPPDFQGRLGWSLSVDRRTLARGEVVLAAEPNPPHRATIVLPIPDVREGLIVEADLSLEVYGLQGGASEAAHHRRLWIFSTDPLAQRAEWLKQLRITLFDPQDDTAAVLREASVPFRQEENVAALADLGEGLLVVGEGTSLEDHRSLPEIMVRAAARGVPVLCLAPSAGVLPMPGSRSADDGLPMPQRVVLRRGDAITALDKRLDADGWPPDGRTTARTITVDAEGGRVVGRIGQAEDGWPWIEWHFSDQQSTLLICGFGVVDHWGAGPTPRYLFARMLELIAPETKTGALEEER